MISITLTRSGRSFAKKSLIKHYERLSAVMSRLTHRERQSVLSAYAKVLTYSYNDETDFETT